MKIIDVEQNTIEWMAARVGIPTASCFDKIVTSKGEPSKQKEKYLFRLAGESVTGIPEESYQNANMIRGNKVEEEARAYYDLTNGVEIERVGFCLADGYGCSPDGFVGKNGLVQFKCPLISTHVGYLLDNKLPTDYIQQVQGELFVTEREWSDFVSYFPCMRPLIVRVGRDEAFIKKLKIELEIFCNDLQETIGKVR